MRSPCAPRAAAVVPSGGLPAQPPEQPARGARSSSGAPTDSPTAAGPPQRAEDARVLHGKRPRTIEAQPKPTKALAVGGRRGRDHFGDSPQLVRINGKDRVLKYRQKMHRIVDMLHLAAASGGRQGNSLWNFCDRRSREAPREVWNLRWRALAGCR